MNLQTSKLKVAVKFLLVRGKEEKNWNREVRVKFVNLQTFAVVHNFALNLLYG
jgi:hypothetical protein